MKRKWFEITYSTWKKDELWKIETRKIWLIPLPKLSEELKKTDFEWLVEDILKKWDTK